MNKNILLTLILGIFILNASLCLAVESNASASSEVISTEDSDMLDAMLMFITAVAIFFVVFAAIYQIVSMFKHGSIASRISNDDELALEFKKNNWDKLPSTSFKRNKYKQFCGVEIECFNDNSKCGFSLEAQKHYGFKEGDDGSIDGDYTAEFRSIPSQGDRLLNQVETFCNELNKRNFKVNKSCGLHIHIETPRELELLKKLYIFYNKSEKLFFKMLPKSRRDNGYCERIKNDYTLKDIKECKSLREFLKKFYETNFYLSEIHQQHGKKRYCWLNMHSIMYRNTLEIRSHAGTLNPKKINNWFLIHLTVRNKLEKMTTEEVYNLKLDKDSFLKLFNKDLREYIEERWEAFPDKSEDNFQKAKEEICVKSK